MDNPKNKGEQSAAFILAGEIVHDILDLFVKTLQEQRRKQWEQVYKAFEEAEIAAKTMIEKGMEDSQEARASLRFEFVKALSGNKTVSPSNPTIN